MKRVPSVTTATTRLKARLWLLLLALPATSHAATTIESILTKSASLLQGSMARALGILAIIGCGYLCIVKQQLPKEKLAMVLLGLGLIFSASYIYTKVVG